MKRISSTNSEPKKRRNELCYSITLEELDLDMLIKGAIKSYICLLENLDLYSDCSYHIYRFLCNCAALVLR